MIKLSVIGIILIASGIVTLGISIAQWFFRFPDPSQLLLGVGIGICFMAFGYLHSWMRYKDKEKEEKDEADKEKFEEFDHAIDGVRICQVDELEKINKRIDNL